eukprot:CAMPEP_0171885858 /NCGR_PEP_ID=MMETSP0992-20121227/41568_1 /TAXON_ID=483369 /ORGANISM="non described non described, Strain CCMP2098" /LENGTH=179 /DNA_ID=CAMNT_0012512431 /DNA_START=149 /DNA_END=688 /DNA_ORIENTATION=+
MEKCNAKDAQGSATHGQRNRELRVAAKVAQEHRALCDSHGRDEAVDAHDLPHAPCTLYDKELQEVHEARAHNAEVKQRRDYRGPVHAAVVRVGLGARIFGRVIAEVVADGNCCVVDFAFSNAGECPTGESCCGGGATTQPPPNLRVCSANIAAELLHSTARSCAATPSAEVRDIRKDPP